MMVMSTNSQPSSSGTVCRKKRDGSTIEVPCPAPSSTTTSLWVELTEGINCVGTTAADRKAENFINIYFSFFSMWQSPTLYPVEIVWFLPLQGLKILSIAARQGSDRGVLQSPTKRSWRVCYPPAAISALPHQAGQQ